MPPKITHRVDCIEGIITILLEGFPDSRYYLNIFGDATLLYSGNVLNNGFAGAYGPMSITGQYIILVLLNDAGEIVYSENFENPCNTIYYDCGKGLFTGDAIEVYVDGKLVSGTVYLEDGEYAIEVRKGSEILREVVRVKCCEYWSPMPHLKVNIVKRECKPTDEEEYLLEICGLSIGETYYIVDVYGIGRYITANSTCEFLTFFTRRGDTLYFWIVDNRYFTLPYLNNTGRNIYSNCGSTNTITTNSCGIDCVIDEYFYCFCTETYVGKEGVIGEIYIRLKLPGKYKFRVTPDPITGFNSVIYPLDGTFHTTPDFILIPIFKDGIYKVEVINEFGAVCRALEYIANCGNFFYDCETGLQSAPAEILVGYANKSFITPTIDNKNLFFPQVGITGFVSCSGYSLPITQTIGGNSISKNICNACCCVYLDVRETRCREGENNTASAFVEVGYNPILQRGLYPKTLEFGGFPNGPIILNVDSNNTKHYLWVDSLEEGSYEFYVRDLTYNSINYADVKSNNPQIEFIKDCVVTKKLVVNCSPCECGDTSMGIVPAELIKCYENHNGTLTFVIKFNFNICPIAVGKTYVTNIQYNVGGKFRGVLEFTEDSLQAQIDKGNAIIHFPLDIGCDDANAVLTIDSLTVSVDGDYCTYGPFTVTGGLCEVCSDVCSCCDISKVSADKRFEYSCAEGRKPGRRIRVYNEEAYDMLFDIVKLPNCNVACCNSINDSNACDKVKEGNIVWSDLVAAKSIFCVDLQDDGSDVTGCYIVKFQKRTDPNCTKCVAAKLVFD